MADTKAIAAATDSGAIIESVVVKGDLKDLSPKERTQYYVEVCKSVGLNPLTKPFEYITLNGRLTLYALRNCTDQLRTLYGVSVEELTETERDGVFIVTTKVKNRDGRTDMAKGAVPIANLKGEALANAMMKAETKAKRRATLSLCGLGFLDETEIETIPASAKGPPPETATEADDAKKDEARKRYREITEEIRNSPSPEDVDAITASLAYGAMTRLLHEVAPKVAQGMVEKLERLALDRKAALANEGGDYVGREFDLPQERPGSLLDLEDQMTR